jgi:hypothetical protein
MSIRAFASVVLALLAAGLAAVAAVFYARPIEPSRNVLAHVTAIAPAGARFPRAIVVAETPGGVRTSASIRWNDFRCHVGDSIQAVQVGVTATIDPATCRAPRNQTSSTNRP